MLKRWLDARKERRDIERFTRGYDTTAGALLRGEVCPTTVDEFVAHSVGYDRYDDGCQAAADAWRQRERILT